MNQKILVVDDDASHRQMIRTVLAAEGYEITEAADGEAAISAVEERFYDLVLLDIRMPRIGGIDALDRIKEINPKAAEDLQYLDTRREGDGRASDANAQRATAVIWDDNQF